MVSEIGPRRWMGEQGAAAVVAAEGLPTMRGLNDCYRLAESRKEYLDGGAWLFHGRTVLNPGSWIPQHLPLHILHIQLANTHME
jgi:hypothetical protein